MHPKVQENVELQEKGGSDVRNSLDTFGQIRTEIQLEEGQLRLAVRVWGLNHAQCLG